MSLNSLTSSRTSIPLTVIRSCASLMNNLIDLCVCSPARGPKKLVKGRRAELFRLSLSVYHSEESGGGNLKW